MNTLSLPYFRSFLLLTLAVGLMGNAKLLLAYKFETNKVVLVDQSRKTSQSFNMVGISSQPKQVIKRAISQSARKRSTQDLLDTFAKISVETESNNKLIIGADSTGKNPKNPIENIAQGSLQNSSQKEANTKKSEASKDKIATTDLSDMPSADLIKMLEASMQTPVIPKQFENIKPSMFGDRFFANKDLAYQAELRLQSSVTYDGRYLRIGYPMGDVPANMGVCTDVVIRSLRGLGIDLQQRVHEDMKRNFHRYPNKWQLSRPDSNIDHRRVPNLMTYFKRVGASLRISRNPTDYKPGNIVAWEMGNGMTHIGIVSTQVSQTSGNPLIVHNIGVGPEISDILFDFKIIGHYNFGNGSNRKGFEPRIAKTFNKNVETGFEDLLF